VVTPTAKNQRYAHGFSTTSTMEEHAFQYESKLAFMFELIGSQSQTPPDEHGMTSLQAEFWRVVWECKDRINSDPKHIRAPTAVREFYLEVEVWGTFCMFSSIFCFP
jgi:hypothetical protein